MREIRYIELAANDEAIFRTFVAADTYPFQTYVRPTLDQVRIYDHAFWVELADATRVGVVQCEDASPIHAEVHIRLRTAYRGCGIGTLATQWLTDWIFDTYPTKHRVEGWTRADNVAMQTMLQRCGYIKEAHLRQDFRTSDGSYMDKLGFAILRQDWQTKTTTPVPW